MQVYVEQVSLTSLSYTAVLDATNASAATAYVDQLQSNASAFSAVINGQLAQFGISQLYAPFATPAQALVRLINITSSSLTAVQNGTDANPQWLMAVQLSMNLVRGCCRFGGLAHTACACIGCLWCLAFFLQGSIQPVSLPDGLAALVSSNAGSGRRRLHASPSQALLSSTSTLLASLLSGAHACQSAASTLHCRSWVVQAGLNDCLCAVQGQRQLCRQCSRQQVSCCVDPRMRHSASCTQWLVPCVQVQQHQSTGADCVSSQMQWMQSHWRWRKASACRLCARWGRDSLLLVGQALRGVLHGLEWQRQQPAASVRCVQASMAHPGWSSCVCLQLSAVRCPACAADPGSA
jgi:hypothetical protein